MGQKIIASSETAAQLGQPVLDFIGQTSPDDKKIVIVTPADAASHQLPHILGQAGIAYHTDVAARDLHYSDNAYNITLTGEQGPVSLTTFGKSKPADQVFSSITGVPRSAIPAIAAMSQDLQTLTLLHEISHSERDPALPQLLVELDADRRANSKYRQAHAHGLVHSAHAPDAMAAMRLMQSMTDTSLLTNSANEVVFAPHTLASLGNSRMAGQIQTEADGQQAIAEMTQAKRTILTQLGAQTMADRDVQNVRLMEVFRMSKEGKIDLPTEQKAALGAQLSQAFEAGGSAAPLQAAIDQLPLSPAIRAELDRRVAQELPGAQLEAGFNQAKARPDQLLKTAAHLQQAGAFDNKPYAQAFVGGFVDGAQTYASAHFAPPVESKPNISLSSLAAAGQLAPPETAQIQAPQIQAPTLQEPAAPARHTPPRRSQPGAGLH